ncbi:MAG: hypothetical protein KAW41_02685 [Candidatus Diapherotrites archaeon]|nr:hypothetical protein [Candidatus Diapherotrites archaeon]
MAGKKELRVAVVGLPSYHYVCEHIHGYHAPGLMPIEEIKKTIEKTGDELGASVKVETYTEFPKLLDYDYDCDEGWRNKHNKQYDDIGLRLKALVKDHDFVFLMGSHHDAAYPVYHLEGKVLRFDAHYDEGWGRTLEHHTYVRHAKNNGLKTDDEVKTFGPELLGETIRVKDPEGGFMRAAEPAAMAALEKDIAKQKDANIIDVDLDCFSRADYGRIGTYPTRSFLLLESVEKATQKCKPKFLVVSEYHAEDDKGKGLEIMQFLARRGVLAAFARKYPSKQNS